MWSVFVQYVHLPPAVYLPAHVGDQRSLWRCYHGYNASHRCHGDICSWKDGLMEHKGLTHVYENPRARQFSLLDVFRGTGFSVAAAVVVVVQARQSTHWSFRIKTSDFSTKGSGGGGVVCCVKAVRILWDVIVLERRFEIIRASRFVRRPEQRLRLQQNINNWKTDPGMTTGRLRTGCLGGRSDYYVYVFSITCLNEMNSLVRVASNAAPSPQLISIRFRMMLVLESKILTMHLSLNILSPLITVDDDKNCAESGPCES